jgi:hypothetical protein
MDSRFQEFGKKVLKKDTAEIGLHVHAWDSPPIVNGDFNPRFHHVYLFELSDEIIAAKINFLTNLLKEAFETVPVSHRAGRWGFDERIARTLVSAGYLVDCSVTPGVSWKRYKGSPKGNGGSDYFGFPKHPYFMDLSNISQSGDSQLLEVPVTIKSNYPKALRQLNHSFEQTLPAKAFRRIYGPPASWLRPDGKNADEMLDVVDWANDQQFPVLEFMLHSSELMPGGSPTFKTAEQIEMLYRDLSVLFARLAKLGVRGMTLAEYRRSYDLASPNVM